MMKSLKQFLLRLIPVLLILGCLAGCGSKAPEETATTQPAGLQLTDEQRNAEALTLVADAETLALLEECTNLKRLDLTGSTCYPEILDYIRRHPEVEVTYTVSLGGGTEVSNRETRLTLVPGDYEAALLLENLAWLPNLTELQLSRIQLDADSLSQLRGSFPGIQLEYTVELLGVEYGQDTTQADLSSMTTADVDAAVAKLPLLPALRTVELMDGNGKSSLSQADVFTLVDTLPAVQFHYTFQLFGQEVSTASTTLEFAKQRVSSSNEAELRSALDIMPMCTSVRFLNTGHDNDVMASIREAYPHANLAWQIQFGNYSFMTDVDTFRTVYNFGNSDAQLLKYFKDIKYIDMGHNPELTDLSFVQYLPKLEILIASGSSVKDLNAFSGCKNLEFLELANCMVLEDISALQSCWRLRFLNLSFSKVDDLSALDDLPLERFVYLSPKISEEAQSEFEEKHPECWTRFTGKDPYNIVWRYDDYGVTFSEYYAYVREIFNYDEIDERIRKEKEEEEARAEEEAKKNQATESTTPSAAQPPATTPPSTTPPATEAPAPPSTTPPATEAPAPPATEAPAPAPTETPAPPAPEAPAPDSGEETE